MFSIIRIITLIAALSLVAVFVYYIIYSQHINSKIVSGEITGRRMLDIPKMVLIVIMIALLIYSLIVSLALNKSRSLVIEENRNTFSVISLSDYTYSGYNGILVDNDASYAKNYSRESNDGYQKTISQDGVFTFTSFTRVGQHDVFHPDFFCFVDYTGAINEEYSLYEFYEYIDTDSMESIGGLGSGGSIPAESILIIGNANETDSFRIKFAILDGKGENEYLQADQKANEDDKGTFPEASDYAVSTGSVVITVP